MTTHRQTKFSLAHCLFLLALTLLFWGVSCKEVTGPGEEEPQTPDTTSHDWQWTITTLGDGGSSSLYDVAIIHDSLAYAVGEIYLRDTAIGQLDPIPYNLAKWNGREWKVEKVGYTFNGNTSYSRQTAVFGFSEKDIWAFSDAPKHWDGEKWNSVQVPQSMFSFGWINKAWGTSSSNFYVVGNNGNLAHYDGSVWQRINSGTGMNIYDIYGDGGEILAVAGNVGSNFERSIFKINNFSTTPLSSDSIRYSLSGIWFKSNEFYYVVGDGIFYKSDLNQKIWVEPFITPYYTAHVKGNGKNDIMICGGVGELLHFNGNNWISFREKLGINGNHYGIDIKRNTCITVGFTGREGFIALGKRK